MRPGNRSQWVNLKCLHREEFVVVGWTDPEGARPRLGALLLAYYDPNGRLVYAGRVGAGIDHAELGRLWRRLRPLATSEMPLDRAPPRSNRFGGPLVLSRVHWVRPELVVEVKYLTWTGDNLLRRTERRLHVAVEVADGKEVTPIVSGDGSTTSWTWPTETHCRTQQDSNNTRLAAAIPQRPDLSGSCKTFSNVPHPDIRGTHFRIGSNIKPG